MPKKSISSQTNAQPGSNVVTADFWFVNKKTEKKIKVKSQVKSSKVSVKNILNIKIFEVKDYQSEKKMPKKFKGENSKAVEAR